MTKQETGRALLRAFGEAARAIEEAKREGGRTLAFVRAAQGRRNPYSCTFGAHNYTPRRAAVYAASLAAAYSSAFGS